MHNEIQLGIETARHVVGFPIIGLIKHNFHRWHQIRKVERELSKLSVRQLADLGLNPGDIHDVARDTFKHANGESIFA